MLLYRNREMAALRERLEVSAEQLHTSLGPALWEYNVVQLNKVLDGGMKERALAGIIIKTGKRVYERSRNKNWEPVSEKPVVSENEVLILEKPLIYSGSEIGTLSLLGTTKFLKEEIMVGVYFFGASILLVDFVLVLSLSWIVSRIVLTPLKNLESYAVSICNGDVHGLSIAKLSFRGEMEVLRSSLEKMFNQLELRYEQLKQEARRLSDGEKLVRTLVNTIPDMIWLKDENGVYLSCNKKFERFFGATEAEIVGKTDYDFVDREQADFFRDNDRRAMAAGEPCSNEEWISFKDDGHRVLLDTTKTPMYDADGNLVGVLGVARDITVRTQAEEEKAVLRDQLAQAQRMESVGRLAGGVAHDFNNMLGVILGHTEMAITEVDPSDQLHEDLSAILSAANRSAALTRQLLAFARKQAVAPRRVDLNETIDGMLKMLARLIGEDIDFLWAPGNGVWPVMIDPSQLDQILANLCVNARDSISDVGRVTIETKNVTFKEDYCQCHSDAIPGDFSMLSVSDTGCGMDKDMLNNIFEPFYTTKETGKGTGLGLATVYGAVRQNNGFINVYSEPGHGTTFRIYLPRHIDDKSSFIKNESSDLIRGGDETILLVEDESSMLKMITSMLVKQGYTVLTAGTPGEAIGLAMEYEGDISLLMTDVIMPEMNGRNLADKLMAFKPSMKILFMSGYTADLITHHGVLNDGVQFIQKPFSKEELAVKVRRVLDT